jgi:FKBP-type peptidyl-prolyl cis-trans isomerase FklB
MRNLRLTATSILSAGFLLHSAAAQQTPAAAPSTTKPRTATSTATHRSSTTAQKPLVLATEKDKQSYAVGLNVGKSLHRDDIEVDPKIVARGMEDALSGGKVLLTDDEIKIVLTQLGTEVRQKQEAKRVALAESNKKDGAAFLAANATKEGVVTLPSGLQYKILTAGTGPKPAATDMVVCNYKGMLLDNTEFDSSYKRGQPATFPVSGVIKGWTEALQLMPLGSKWELFIPADLAYGERARDPIPPNAVLVFEIELLSIKPREQPAAAPATATPPPATSAPATSEPATSTPPPPTH